MRAFYGDSAMDEMKFDETIFTDTSDTVLQGMAEQSVSDSFYNNDLQGLSANAAYLNINANDTLNLNDLIQEAVSLKASDIHIKEGEPLICRIDGKMLRVSSSRKFEAEDIEVLLSNCMDEKHKKIFAEEHQIDFAYETLTGLRLRCNAFEENGKVGMVLRLLKNGVPNLLDLEVPSILTNFARISSGLVLVTGPTGSGKTTTLAGILNEINTTQQKHIITLEDPIEYTYVSKSSVVRQREIGRDVISFADGLRAALREDPDVILVGELRDLESISIALTAAETGHLVFGTLHTLGASKTIDRLVDVFPAVQQQQIRVQLSGVLKGVISQKLLKRTDKQGRIAAFEIMVAVPAIVSMIREGKWTSIDNAITTGAGMGMLSLNKHLASLVNDGKIARETAFAASNNIEDLKNLIL